VAGQELSGLRVDTAPGEVGDEGVAEGVEVHDTVRRVAVGNPRHLQIAPEDAGQLFPAREAEDGLPGGLVHEVLAERRGGGLEQRQRVIPAVLGISGQHANRGQVESQAERLRRQAADLRGPKPGLDREAVEHGAVRPRETPRDDTGAVPAEALDPLAGGPDQTPELLLCEGPAVMPAVRADVEHFQVRHGR
jgi:hypothetical protein